MLPSRRSPRGDGAKPVAAVGRRAIKRTMRKLMDRGDAIGDVPEADELHALRIRGKRLRYVLEALKPISGAPGKKLTRKLVRLQDVLGRFNDSMVAATFLRAYLDGPGGNADADERATLVALADRELRRAGAAQSDFARAWNRFTGKATLRERRALLRKLKAAARSAADSTGVAAAHVPQLGGI
jgi:CHAD domain-containing protein